MSRNNDNTFNPDILGLRRDPEGGYRVWRGDEIYLGKPTKGLWVPNVGDKVDFYDGVVLKEKRVIALDESTLIPILEDISRPKVENEDDIGFIGVGPALNAETWRLFYDRNVEPHTLMVDSSLVIRGDDASYIKIFKGTDTTRAGKVISMYRDNTGSSYSENVPVVILRDRHSHSTAEKRPQLCHTTEHLERGEVVTVVVYSESGKIMNETRMLVADGSNVKALDAPTAYVMGIELISPFLSESEDKVLEVPVNISIDGLFTLAKVIMSDGNHRTMAIDGGRVSILGFDHYIATRQGETGSFALKYTLDENEHAWNTNTGVNRHITEIYRYRTIDVDGSYGVMLHVIPVFDRYLESWKLKYIMHSLNRDIRMDVTDYIEQGVNATAFNGRSYGTYQHIVVALQLDKLGLGLKPFRYVQQFDISLMRSSGVHEPNYLINYDNEQQISYGVANKVHFSFDRDGVAQINLNEHNRFTNMDDFLAKTFKSARPLYNAYNEASAPLPTHFVVRTTNDGEESTFPISDYARTISVPTITDQSIRDGDTLIIDFVKQSELNTFYLCSTAWVVERQG